VAGANVELSYHQLDVNIAAEYEPGSCQYEAILEHELEHVAVAQQIMSPYAQQIEQALTTLSIPTPDLPSIADSPDQARAEVQEVFRRVLLPVRDQMNQLVRARQADVDTPENYRWTFKKCRRW
jgi:phosphoenolpyruvate carboxylase